MQSSAHMGEGDWSGGRAASSSCCQFEFARQGPPQLIQCSTRHTTHTHTHQFYWLVRAASSDSWASPVCLTRSSTFLSVKAFHCKPKDTAHVSARELRLTAIAEEAVLWVHGWGCRGGYAEKIQYGSVWCTQNSLLFFLRASRRTILPLFRKTPFRALN